MRIVPDRRIEKGAAPILRYTSLLVMFAILFSCGGCASKSSMSTTAGASAADESKVEGAPRLALLIGNSSYQDYGAWDNIPTAEADAQGMARIAARAHFTLIGDGPQLNVTASKQADLIRQLLLELQNTPNATVLIYFSGHGFSTHGRNMLVPIDGPLPKPNSEAPVGGSVTDISTNVAESGAGTVLMFLDACRDSTTEGIGFGDEPAPRHTFIEFGSYFGTSAIALEHSSHSAFTQALLDAFNLPWETLEELHNLSALMVASKTNFRQVPVYRSDPEVLHLQLHLVPENESTLLGRAGTWAPNPAVTSAANRCAADGDLRLAMKSRANPPFGPEGLSISLVESSISAREIFEICRKAMDAGARDPSVLRGAAMATIVALGVRLDPGPTNAEITSSVGWLYQAAEKGDPVAESYVAWLESGAYGFKSASIDPSRATKRALHAAETGRSPFGVLVAMALISGTNSPALPFYFKKDRERGFDILTKSVEQFDPMAIGFLYLYRLDERKGWARPVPGSLPEPLKAINLREILHSSLEKPDRNPDIMALVIPGLSRYQTINSFALQDAFLGIAGPPDLVEFVRLAVIAEPWFSRYEDWAQVSVSSSYVAGCALVGGLHFISEKRRVPRNDAVGKRFLQFSANNGNPDAQRALDIALTGKGMPCSIDGDDLSAKLSHLVN